VARFSRTKTIYVDIATGRLIPKKLAERRPPETWRAEEVEIEIEVENNTNFSERPSLKSPRSLPSQDDE